MIYIIYDILKTSVYISIPIILIVLLKNKFLSKYTYKFNYILCILITLRMLFISNIQIYLPAYFSKPQNTTTLKNIDYLNSENIILLNHTKILFIIWLLGVLYFLFKTFYKQTVFYSKLQNVTFDVYDCDILTIFDEEKKSLNINKSIKLLKVDGLFSPALINIFNSKIIIPNKEYEETHLRWIFRHELIHFKRKDNLMKLLLTIACAIHWFNPLVLLLKSHFEEQCELSCDEKVLIKYNLNEIKEYALVLVNTLKYRNTLKATMLNSQFKGNQINLIKRRIEEMMNLKKRKKGIIIATFLCGISALSVLSFNLIYKQNTAYANQSKINNEINSESNEVTPESSEDSQVKPKIITDEELRNNLKNIKINDVKDEIRFYQDKRFDDLTQEEVDYAMDFLLTGKSKRVIIGTDASYSINTDYLYKGDE